VRKILVGAALGALLTILLVAPAGAVAPNEVLIAKHFQQMGLIPQYANPAMATATVNAIVGSGPNYELKMPLVKRVLDGKRTALGRFADPHRTHDCRPGARRHPGACRRRQRYLLAG